MEPIELGKYQLPLSHKSGLPAEIVRDPADGNWIIPGGKRFIGRGQAVRAAIPIFKEIGGWK